ACQLVYSSLLTPGLAALGQTDLRSDLPAWVQAAPTSRLTDPARRSAAQRAEEGADVLGEQFGLLHRGEVAAARHHGPAADIGVGAFRERAWRTQDFARELAVAGWNIDCPALRDRPWPMHAEVIRKERGADRGVSQYRLMLASN